jgi:hypothetical protein
MQCCHRYVTPLMAAKVSGGCGKIKENLRRRLVPGRRLRWWSPPSWILGCDHLCRAAGVSPMRFSDPDREKGTDARLRSGNLLELRGSDASELPVAQVVEHKSINEGAPAFLHRTGNEIWQIREREKLRLQFHREVIARRD